MSILGSLTSQQVIGLYNVFAVQHGTSTIKKFRDAETGRKRLQDISRGLERSVVVAAMKKAGIDKSVIAKLPTTPIVIAIPEKEQTFTREIKKLEVIAKNDKVLAAERSKESAKVKKEEKRKEIVLRKEMKMTEGCADVFAAIRKLITKRDGETDTTILAKQLNTSVVAVSKAVEKLQKLNLVKVEDDSPDDSVKLWYISLTTAGWDAKVPRASTAPTSTAEPKTKKKALPGEKPGPRSNHSGKCLYKLVKDNPRREGTHGWKSFNLIKDGMTREAYLEAGGRRNDLQWDIERKYVELR